MAKKKNDRLKCFVKARHAFTEDEWKKETLALTRAMEQVGEAEEQAKADSAKAKADIKQLKSTVNDLANKVRSGGEDRDVEAMVEFVPKKGYKIIRHHCPSQPEHDTEIRREPMTQLDYEGNLPFEEEPEKKKEGDQTAAPDAGGGPAEG